MPEDGEVIIDDGGSTRIKQLGAGPIRPGATGILDALLDVTGAPPQANATAVGPFSQLVVASLDSSGSLIVHAGFPVALIVGDSFDIISDNNQKTVGRIVDNSATGGTAADCVLTIKGGGGGCKPIPEAKRSGTQRRYVISNAGGITDVNVTLPGPRPNPSASVAGNVYNAVILS